ncbi:MAG: dihydroorotate dehydrogenase electron transfer subunit [Bacteroidales bacterium]|nr:dihydroorotate dehydrogenase electron transfer subunit [Bacteroidales bacterium]
MKKHINNLKIISYRSLNKDFFLLELSVPHSINEIRPGQFVEVLVENSAKTFLRRPFSIHDIDYENQIISLLIQIVGKGTRELSKQKSGEYLNLIYPLGNSFSKPTNEKTLLIGGGAGIAPLLFLAKHFKRLHHKFSVLLGARSENYLVRLKEFKKLSEVFIATEDASLGEKGLVTNHSVLTQAEIGFDKIISCGPKPMMKAVAMIATDKAIDCEVSLENTMACGIGACLCCVEETKHGNVCVCIDGPVFNVKDLKWLI